MKPVWLALLILVIASAPAVSWEIPPDNGTMGREAIDAILAGNDYPETSTSTQRSVHHFTAHVHDFTQVVVTLNQSGRGCGTARSVVVGGEPGREYGRLRLHHRRQGRSCGLARETRVTLSP